MIEMILKVRALLMDSGEGFWLKLHTTPTKWLFWREISKSPFVNIQHSHMFSVLRLVYDFATIFKNSKHEMSFI